MVIMKTRFFECAFIQNRMCFHLRYSKGSLLYRSLFLLIALLSASAQAASVSCGTYQTTIQKATTATQCSFSWTELGLTAPTAETFGGSSTDVLVWKRTSRGSTVSDLDVTNYAVGNHFIVWSVEGMDGECLTTIKVTDEVAPYFDCSTLTTKTVYADENGTAASGIVWGKQIYVPVATDCSATNHDSTTVNGVPTRSDSRNIEDDYDYQGKNGSIVVTWRFTDKIGNYSTCPQTILVVDTTRPKLNCTGVPDYLTVLTSNNEDKCDFSLDEIETLNSVSFPTSAADLSATDNCTKGDSRTFTFATTRQSEGVAVADLSTPYGIGTHVLTFTVTDEAGNKNYCTSTISVKDQAAPVVSGCNSLAAVSVSLDNGECSKTFTEAELKASLPSATDCSGATTISSSRSDGKAINDAFQFGTTTIYWTYSDKFGNKTVCPQSVIVTDNTKPDVSAKCSGSNSIASQTLTLAPDQCSVSQAQVLAYLNPQSVSDGCDGSIDGVPSVSGSSFSDGTYSVEWTFTDKNGNSSTCSQTLIVKDNTKPDVTNVCPGGLSLTADACELSYTMAIPFVLDNCDSYIYGELSGIDPSAVTINNSTHQATVNFPLGTTNLTWTFTDAAGNSSTCPQVVELSSGLKPVISGCPSSTVTVTLTANNNCNASWNDDVKGQFSAPTAKQPCGDQADITPSITRVYRGLSGSEYNSESGVDADYKPGYTDLTYHFVTTDGVEDSCVVTIYVDNKAALNIDCSQLQNNVTVSLNSSVTCAEEISEVALNGLNTLTVTDACGNTITPVPVNTTAGGTLSDPKLTFPLSISAGSSVTIDWYYVSTLDASVSAHCPQTIEVKDVSKPVFDCGKLSDVTVDATSDKCYATWSELSLPSLKALDNCGDIYAYGIRSDSSSAAETKLKTGQYPIGTTKITWYFVDAAGNTTNCEQNVIVKDVTAPTPSPANCSSMTTVNLNLSALTSACEYSLAQVEDNLTAPTATDACSSSVTATLAYGADGSSALPSSFAPGNYTLTWMFQDASHNKSFCYQPLNIYDDVKPDVSTLCPGNALADKVVTATSSDCSMLVPLVTPVLSDACDGNISAIFTRSDSSNSNPMTRADKYSLGTTVVTWTFYDAAGNNDYCKQNIIVKDESAPTIDCTPFDGTYKINTTDSKCSFSLSELSVPYPSSLNDLSATDNADACVTNNLSLSYSLSKNGVVLTDDYSTYTYGLGSYVLTYIVMDNAGKTAQCSTSFDVVDENGPEVDCSSLSLDDVTGVADNGNLATAGSLSGLKTALNITNDACSPVSGTQIAGVATRSDGASVSSDYPLGTTVVTWTFSDALGNQSTCKQRVVVTAASQPSINCGAYQLSQVLDIQTTASQCSFSLEDLKTAGLNQPTSVSDLATVSYADNPYALSWSRLSNGVSVASLTEEYEIGTHVINWIVTDKYNNQAVCSNTVKISDKTAPTFNCSTLGDLTVYAGDDCKATISQAELAGFSIPVATDACSPTLADGSVPASFSCFIDGVEVTSVPSEFKKGEYNIKWNFKDGSDNMLAGGCSQKLTVLDNVAPTLDCTVLPSAKTFTIDESVADCNFTLAELGVTLPTNSDFSASDNCTDDSNLIMSWNRVSNGVDLGTDVDGTVTKYETGTHLLTFTVTDADNNSKACKMSIVVADKKKPVVANCSSLDKITVSANSSCQANRSDVTLIAPSYSDCNSVSYECLLADGSALPSVFAKGETEIQWIFTDIYGMQTVCSQIIDVVDKTKPSFDGSYITAGVCEIPAETLYTSATHCQYDSLEVKLSLSTPAVSDNCASGLIPELRMYDALSNVVLMQKIFGSQYDAYKLVWMLSDGVNDAVYCPQNVYVIDNSNPVIDVCPEDIEVESAGNTCNASVTLDVPFITDPCDGVIYATHNLTSYVDDAVNHKVTAVFSGESNVIWTFTDKANNSSTCTQKVSVKDKTAPVVNCGNLSAADLTFDITSSCSLPVASVSAKVSADMPSATDNCSAAPVMSSKRVYRGVDGNSTPVVVENSGVAIEWNDASVDYQVGVTDVVFTFTDESNNAASCSLTVTVNNKNKPVVTCSDIAATTTIHPAEAVCSAPISAAYLVSLNPVKAKEYCSNDYITPIPVNHDGGTLSSPNLPSSVSSGNSLSIDWYYVAANGQSVVCSEKNIYVEDNVAPSYAQCGNMPDMTFKADDNCEALVSVVFPIASDNCGDITGVPDYNFSNPMPLGTTVVSWKFEDSNPANTLVCAQNFIVSDETKPVIDCSSYSQNLEVDADATNCNVALATSGLNVPTSVSDLYATDNCSATLQLVLSYNYGYNGTESSVLPSDLGLGTHSFDWIVTDAYGNYSSCHSEIVVKDVTGPEFACSSLTPTISVATDSRCVATAAAVRLAGLSVPSTNSDDACSPVGGVIKATGVRSDSPLLSVVDDEYPIGTTVVTWSFADAAGNVTTCSQDVYVHDDDAPEVVCGDYGKTYNLTTNATKCSFGLSDISLLEPNISDLSASDNCSSASDLTLSWTYDGNSLSSVDDIEFTVSSAPHLIVWTVTDVAGVSSSCTTSVYVDDKEGPFVDCSAIVSNVMIDADNGCAATAAHVALAVPAISDDYCSPIGSNITGVGSRSDNLSLSDDYPVGETVVTWTFTDNASNISVCPQKVDVYDNSAPSVANCNSLEDVVINIDDAGICYVDSNAVKSAITTPVVTDCGGVAVSALRAGNDGLTLIPNEYKIGTTTRLTWVFADAVGNKTVCYQNVKVEDKAKPDTAGICPKKVKVVASAADCKANVSLDIPVIINDCDAPIYATPVRTPSAAMTDPYELGQTVVTWNFVDKNGNSSYCEQVVEVVDESKPTFDCQTLADSTFYLAAGECNLSDADVVARFPQKTAVDACSGNVVGVLMGEDENTAVPAQFVVDKTTGTNVYMLTWTFNDGNGNIKTCPQKVTVVDTMAPVIPSSVCSDETVSLSTSEQCGAEWSIAAPVIPATCISEQIEGIFSRSDGLDASSLYPTEEDVVVTYTFTSAYGAKSYCRKTIHVSDETSPTVNCVEQGDTTIYLKASKCSLSASEILYRLPIMFADDNCDGFVVGEIKGATKADVMPLDFTAGSESDLTWLFTDAAGMQSTCSFKLTVKDTIKPDTTGVCPADVMVPVDNGSCSAVLALTTPVINETCGDIVAAFDRDDDHSLGVADAYPAGHTTITWTFTDASQNTSVCVQNIYVVDDVAPVVACGYATDYVEKITLTSDLCSLKSSDLVSTITAPTAHDACENRDVEAVTSLYYKGVDGSEKPTLVRNSAGEPVHYDDADYNYELGYTDIHFVFSDAGGNTDSCVVSVSVIGSNIPVVDCGDSVSPLRLSAPTGACAVDLTAKYLKSMNNVKAHDVCLDQWLIAEPYDTLGNLVDNMSLPCGTDLVVNWTYTSVFGVNGYCRQTISAIDSVAPIFDCTTLDTIKLVAKADECGVVYSSLNIPVAADNCGNINGVASRNDMLDLNEPYPVGKTVLTWKFADTNEDNTLACEQVILVADTMAPTLDCSVLSSPYVGYTSGSDCDLTETELGLTTAVDASLFNAVDCSNMAVEVYRVFGSDTTYVLNSPYGVGRHEVIYKVTDDYGNSSFCSAFVEVIDSQAPIVDCSVFDTIYASADKYGEARAERVLQNGLFIPSVADDYCSPVGSDIYALGLRSDKPVFAVDVESYPLGATDITWIFTDASGNSAYCKQTVVVNDSVAPDIECNGIVGNFSVSVVVPTDSAECSVPYAELGIDIPADEIDLSAKTVGGGLLTLSRSRVSNGVSVGDLTLPYELGTHYLTWTVTDQNGLYSSCVDTIEIIDSRKPRMKCDDYPSVIFVASDIDCDASAAKVEQAGLVVPKMEVASCSAVTEFIMGVGSRSDSLTMSQNYPIDTTIVTWTFADALGHEAYCTQLVVVVDSSAPVMTNCDSMPDVTIYAQSDCSISSAKLVSELSYTASDNCDAQIYGVPGLGLRGNEPLPDYFDAQASVPYNITWVFKDKSGNAAYCRQALYVVDTVPPVWSGDVRLFVDTLISCSIVEIPEFPVADFVATDNCSDVSYHYTRSSNRENIYTECSHYDYDLVYSYWAEDEFGNASDTVYYTFRVRDTIAPVVSLPNGWAADSIYPTYQSGCYFSVPDLMDILPLDSIFDNCNASEYLHIWQEPDVDDTITSSATITLYIEDICGNLTTVTKGISVPKLNDVCHILANNIDACGGDDNLTMLNSEDVRTYSGNHYVLSDGAWVIKESDIRVDCYRDSISSQTVVYSNNPLTYGSRFMVRKQEVDSIAYRCNRLRRASQSGTYFYVAMDQATQCTDTVSIDVKVKERPRVSLQDIAYKVCESDSLSLADVMNEADVCVNDMGAELVAEGWIINGKKYSTEDFASNFTVNDALIYYAENVCGTATSDSSLFVSCYDLSADDSLSVAGSEANLKLMRSEDFITSHSVSLDVRMRYKPEHIVLTSNPSNPSRIWIGDDAELILKTDYSPVSYQWYKVVDGFDAAVPDSYDKYGNFIGSQENDDMLLWNADSKSFNPDVMNLYSMQDTSSYYVVVSDGVCPAVASNIVRIDVNNKIPTAITPYDKDGLNDVFMKGHFVEIFNRYGQKLLDSYDGWDGYYRGLLVDPGVYYYVLTLSDKTYKGSIEVVRIKH